MQTNNIFKTDRLYNEQQIMKLSKSNGLEAEPIRHELRSRLTVRKKSQQNIKFRMAYVKVTYFVIPCLFSSKTSTLYFKQYRDSSLKI